MIADKTRQALTKPGASKGLPVWERDIDRMTQISIDRILDYMVRHGLRPRVKATDDIIGIATTLVNAMQAQIPPALHDDLNMALDHLIAWLCDYADHTGTRHMRVTFGFEEGAVRQ